MYRRYMVRPTVSTEQLKGNGLSASAAAAVMERIRSDPFAIDPLPPVLHEIVTAHTQAQLDRKVGRKRLRESTLVAGSSSASGGIGGAWNAVQDGFAAVSRKGPPTQFSVETSPQQYGHDRPAYPSGPQLQISGTGAVTASSSSSAAAGKGVRFRGVNVSDGGRGGGGGGRDGGGHVDAHPWRWPQPPTQQHQQLPPAPAQQARPLQQQLYQGQGGGASPRLYFNHPGIVSASTTAPSTSSGGNSFPHLHPRVHPPQGRTSAPITPYPSSSPSSMLAKAAAASVASVGNVPAAANGAGNVSAAAATAITTSASGYVGAANGGGLPLRRGDSALRPPLVATPMVGPHTFGAGEAAAATTNPLADPSPVASTPTTGGISAGGTASAVDGGGGGVPSMGGRGYSSGGAGGLGARSELHFYDAHVKLQPRRGASTASTVVATPGVTISSSSPSSSVSPGVRLHQATPPSGSIGAPAASPSEGSRSTTDVSSTIGGGGSSGEGAALLPSSPHVFHS